MHFWGHLKTISHHRWLVCQGCFRVGLYRQGLTHDLSKFSPTEFWQGVKYYQGTRSPNEEEREELGYSPAWMHHKGRNRHHYEYWVDIDPKTRLYGPVEMPIPDTAEMFCDRVAASRVYRGKQYTPASPMNYFTKSREHLLMHPETERALTFLLEMLRDRGEEETFRYIRTSVLKNKPFPWETE